ncbi:MAG: hybrid sensor histidine kinase/response regulator [Candidatus Sericytochromatia bacterium]|nr:hybrid sensor histidine kinase/response regulator [Candidatus Sericytochromatia bacterium]
MDANTLSGYILIVDDNPNNLRLLITLLSEQGYETRPANNGARALNTVQKQKPDLILLDINMPEMDGYEVCRQLKAMPETADIPVLFISANDELHDKVKGFDVGGVDYISKPFEPQELFARVRTHLQLKQAQDQLKALNHQLQASNRFFQHLGQVKDEFLGMVSHDLKNPLSSILLFSRYMESRTLSEDKAREMGRLITKAGKRMFRLIEDLLDLNKLEQGELTPELQRFDLLPLVQDVCAEYQEKAQAKGQSLNSTWETESAWIVADPLRVRQVLENLLSNALKFSPPQSEIAIRLQQEGQRVCLQVRDQGPGLSEADQAQLFEKFMRLSAKPTGGEHSSGLGLSISKKLVEAMSGTIGCTSQLGQGACFFVTFPLSPQL